MLDKIDLSKKLDKTEYRQIVPGLRERLGELQRKAHAAGVPVMIVFEGWEASGKGTLINELIKPLDPRGFRVHFVRSEEDNNQNVFWPPMKRFWDITPARGRIAIYNHSWYRLALDGAAAGPQVYEDISSFERQLTEDGYVIVKFFIHIGKKEQRLRLEKMDADKASKWRASDDEWRENKRYDKRVTRVEEMIQYTDTDFAPWTIVEGHDRRHAAVKILSVVEAAIGEKLRAVAASVPAAPAPEGEEKPASAFGVSTLTPSVLRNLDLAKFVAREDYDEELPKLQKKLRELQYELYKARKPMVIAFEGQDAAGKGGCIKRLTAKLDPRGYQVTPTSSPNDWERAHHYLWRFWNVFPKAGHIGIYDRSWYGRVLVERVEGFAREDEWRRAYAEINEMEDQWARFGTIIVKFWLQVDQEEQLARFNERTDTPGKNWKITDEDWRNREKWPRYEAAAEEMMLRTSTTYAPWITVEANDKLHARIKVLTSAVAAARDALG
jgi:polyphosphate:AMP phosphotransferase